MPLPSNNSNTILHVAAVIDGEMTISEITEVLEHLSFERRQDALCPLLLDREARTYLVDALRRRHPCPSRRPSFRRL